MKLEPAFLASEGDVMYTNNFQYPRARGWARGRGYREQSYSRGYKIDRGGFRKNSKYAKPVNPKDVDGNPMTCHGCGSYRHFIGKCPHSHENISKNQANISETTEKVVLFTGYHKGEIQRLGEEAINCAVLDTACTSIVCGKRWLQYFLEGSQK